MPKSLISLGANLGKARFVLQQAGELLQQRFGANNINFSRVIQTPAIGGPDGQAAFYNAVAAIESSYSAFEILQVLQDIEHFLGRQRRHRWEARLIDLDVLLHDQERIWTPTFKLPHPRMTCRTFALEPACDVAANWIEPVTGHSIEFLANQLRLLNLGSHDTNIYPEALILVLADDSELLGQVADITRLTLGERVLAIEFLEVAKPPRHQNGNGLSQFRHILSQAINIDLVDSLRWIVYAGRSPDPSIIHWEDFCRPWAEAFGIVEITRPDTEASHPMNLTDTSAWQSLASIPKYLLKADEPNWAAHELSAGLSAMACPVKFCGEFFESI